MGFLTSYIYPLEEKICISKRLNISFQNPQTKEEIARCEQYLRDCFEADPLYEIPDNALAQYIHRSLEVQAEDNVLLRRFLEQNQGLGGVALLARMWILEQNEGVTSAFDKAGYLFQLLMNSTGTYRCRKMALPQLDDRGSIPHREISDVIFSVYIFLASIGDPEPLQELMRTKIENAGKERQFGWSKLAITHAAVETFLEPGDLPNFIFFPSAKKDLFAISTLIDRASFSGFDERLAYLCDFLELIQEGTKDDRIAAVLWVSLLEALVTHRPNPPEDTLRRQFTTKIHKIICGNDPSKNPNRLADRLQEIYTIRSQIAHGNWRQVEDYFKPQEKDLALQDHTLRDEIIQYGRVILMEYLRDPARINALKFS